MQRMWNELGLVACLVPLFISTSASASVIGTTGPIAQIAAPASVDVNALESDTTVFLFEEQVAFILPTELSAEITSPTTVVSPGSGITPGTIAAGTAVDSFFLHADTATPDVPFIFDGSITFDREIIAVILFGSTLDASDLLGAAGTVYPAPGSNPLRGIAEPGSSGDAVTLSGDRRTLTFTSRVTELLGVGQDQLRIVTQATAVPEPGTLWLIGLGLFSSALFRRRRCT